MNNNPVGWFEIYVQDIPRSRSFYQNVFSIELDELNMPDAEMWTFPMNEAGKGISGALVKTEGVSSGGNSTMVYFTCEDCAVEESRVAGQGGKVVRSKFSIGEYGFVSLVTDTEGNKIGLHSLK